MANINQADVQYQALLKRILTEGEYEWNERTQTGTLSKFGDQMEFNLQEGFPLLTTKKMASRLPFEEMLFFLRGDDDLKILTDKNVNLWNDNGFGYYVKKHGFDIKKHTKEWADKRSEFIEKVKSGEMPREDRSLDRIYGVQWRDWKTINSDGEVESTDQLANMINKLKEGDRTSRSNIVTAQNPGERDQMALDPCHLMYQTRVVEDKNRLDLLMYQRSCDTILGVPFNMAQYALALNMMAHEIGLEPGYFQHILGNVHYYAGTGERNQFLRNKNNLTELQDRVKKAETSQDYVGVRNWYLNAAPKEDKYAEGIDHIPFAIKQLSRKPASQSPNLEFKVSEDTSFWDMINMDKKDLVEIKNYHPHGELDYKWGGKIIKPKMAP